MEIHFEPPKRWYRYLIRIWEEQPDQSKLVFSEEHVCSSGHHAIGIGDDVIDAKKAGDYMITYLPIPGDTTPPAHLIMRGI